MTQGAGTKESPWVLTTPPGSSEYEMYRDESADPPALVCVVGKTTLSYQLRALDELHAMLKEHGDWMRFSASGRAEARRQRHRRGLGALARELVVHSF
jgi:hypothetical protein